jgi:hypothetical protein
MSTKTSCAAMLAARGISGSKGGVQATVGLVIIFDAQLTGTGNLISQLKIPFLWLQAHNITIVHFAYLPCSKYYVCMPTF